MDRPNNNPNAWEGDSPILAARKLGQSPDCLSANPRSIGDSGSRTGHIGFSLLAFLCGAAAVYAVGYQRAHQAPDQVAAAFVWQRTASSAARHVPNAATIREELLSDATLDQVAERLSPTDRASVLVQVDSNASRGHSLIAVRVTDPDAERAVGLANRLAEQYFKRHAAAAADAKAGQHELQSRTDADQARQRYLAARQRLDLFLDTHFRQRPSDTDRPADPSTVQSKRPPTESSPPTVHAPERVAVAQTAPSTIENRLWLDLDRQRTELLQRRSQFLVDRTPLHPDVQELDVQIAILERRLAQVPRRVAATSATPSATVPVGAAPTRRGPSEPAEAVSARRGSSDPTETAREYLALRKEVDQAEKVRDQAAEQELQAWQRQLGAPAMEIQLADHAEPESTLRQQVGILAMSLLAGLIVAAGVGMFSAGFTSRDQPFSSPRQVETALSIPVVGVISGNKAAQKTNPHLSTLLARFLFQLGLLVILVGGIGMLVVMMNSQGPLVPN